MDENEILEKINRTPLLISYFSYPECNVCRVLRPKVEQMVSELSGTTFLYVDTHTYRQISGQFIVFAVPTIIIFHYGKELKRVSRHISVSELRNYLERMIQLQEAADEPPV